VFTNFSYHYTFINLYNHGLSVKYVIMADNLGDEWWIAEGNQVDVIRFFLSRVKLADVGSGVQ